MFQLCYGGGGRDEGGGGENKVYLLSTNMFEDELKKYNKKVTLLNKTFAKYYLPQFHKVTPPPFSQ
jgi:hypothetical protein